jgi:hypothetical protein
MAPASTRRWLGIILCLGLVLRLAALWATQATGLVNDEYSYFTLAKRVALGAEIGNADARAPGVVFSTRHLCGCLGPQPMLRALATSSSVVCRLRWFMSWGNASRLGMSAWALLQSLRAIRG